MLYKSEDFDMQNIEDLLFKNCHAQPTNRLAATKDKDHHNTTLELAISQS